MLYQAVVDPGLTTKKWGNKDLPLKPGETIDVIVKAQDGKLIGRNKDGKCELTQFLQIHYCYFYVFIIVLISSSFFCSRLCFH